MAHIAWYDLLRHVRRLSRAERGCASDSELLSRFATDRNDQAFAELIDRHGPMVWGLCRRLLRDTADAEDAFQATFLILVRKAGHIGRPELLGGWLHGVAHRVAVRLHGTIARRRALERPYDDLPARETVPDFDRRELQSLLELEVSRLPGRYRVPFVLCHLQGLTVDETARRMRCPTGTVKSRLSRAREQLRAALTRRGVVISTAAFADALAQEGEAAFVPEALAAATCATGRAFAAGTAHSLSTTSTVNLAEGVLTNMFLTKLKLAAGLAIAVVLMGLGGQLIARQGNGPADPPTPTPNVEQRAGADPARAGESNPAAPTPEKHKGRRDLAMRDALRGEVAYAGLDDPKTTLADALEQLSNTFNVRFDVNEKAFKAEHMDDVLRTEIATLPLRPMTGTLDMVLRKILSRINVPSGATYLIRKGHIEITTGAFFWAETGPDLRGGGGPPLEDGEVLEPGPGWFKSSTVYEEFDNELLPVALATIAKWTDQNIVVDPRAFGKEPPRVTASLHNVQVNAAVRILAELAGLQVVPQGNVLFVTTHANAARLRKEWKEPNWFLLEQAAKKKAA
jgi:RNA polymerase sigma factor (sigma-70 family)